MNKGLLIIVLLVALVVLGACGILPGSRNNSADGKGLTPLNWSFETQDLLTGDVVSEAIFTEADLTMVNFWGTYCGPCLREMPDLGELARAYASDDSVQIIGIVVDVTEEGDTAAKAREIVAQTEASYPHLLASQDVLVGAQGSNAVPTTIFVDKEGNLVGSMIVGAKSKEHFQSEINKRLAEATR